MIYWLILLILVGFLAYVRLAPSDPERWHRSAAIKGTETKQLKGGYIWRQALTGDGKAELAALDQAAMATPRTAKLAGSVEEGQVTYVTRSAMIGFPDYTTLSILSTDEGSQQLEVYGRLRFGRSDFGVNTNRIKGWLNAAHLGG